MEIKPAGFSVEPFFHMWIFRQRRISQNKMVPIFRNLHGDGFYWVNETKEHIPSGKLTSCELQNYHPPPLLTHYEPLITLINHEWLLTIVLHGRNVEVWRFVSLRFRSWRLSWKRPMGDTWCSDKSTWQSSWGWGRRSSRSSARRSATGWGPRVGSWDGGW